MKSFKMLFLLSTIPVIASAGWSRTYGGSGVDFDRHILRCLDGNYAIQRLTRLATPCGPGPTAEIQPNIPSG